MAYPTPLYRNFEGNLQEKQAVSKLHEEELRKIGFVAIGEGFLIDHTAPEPKSK